MKEFLKPVYNGAYSFLRTTLAFNPFIAKKISGKKVLNGHARYEQETNPDLDLEIVRELKQFGLPVGSYWIDQDRFMNYLDLDLYSKEYYHAGKVRDSAFIEKALEHFISIDLLKPTKDSVCIDVGSGNSPFGRILTKICGTKNSYRQDLCFPGGVTGDKIGGDASSMPFDDNSVDAITLHCAFEHFEGRTDVKFLAEAQRVLKKGGKLIILPFYLSSAYTIHLDPVNNILKAKSPVIEDDEAVIRYCDSRQSFSRHYDPKAMKKRLLSSITGMHIDLFHVKNFRIIHPDCYLRFIALFTKQ